MKNILKLFIVFLLIGTANAQTYNTLDTGSIQSILQNNFPFIYPSNGSVTAGTGVVNLGTTMDQTYPFAYMYFPAGVYTGSTAGWYYVTCSTAFTCTMYQNQYISGIPQIPANPILVTTGLGAYTQTTSSNILGQQLILPANIMGNNGKAVVSYSVTHPNTGGTKNTGITFGGGACPAVAITTGFGEERYAYISNQSATNIQLCMTTAGNIQPSNAFLAVDTTVAQIGQLRYTISNAVDWMVVHDVNITITK
jgi:hypothetical protein